MDQQDGSGIGGARRTQSVRFWVLNGSRGRLSLAIPEWISHESAWYCPPQ